MFKEGSFATSQTGSKLRILEPAASPTTNKEKLDVVFSFQQHLPIFFILIKSSRGNKKPNQK